MAHDEIEKRFCSNVPRLMFPLHAAPTRLGIEQGLRGQPHCGPGSYGDHPITIFLLPQDQKPKSLNGWYFGCRTAKPRANLITKNVITPSPVEYQHISLDKCKLNYTPFNAIAPRFPPAQYIAKYPGPGQYDHDVETNRRPEYHHSFGGKPTLKETVRIKCTNGVPEQCQSCRITHVGDYYESQGITLCPKCYNTYKNSNTQIRNKLIKEYVKVRDCSTTHKHEFPGFPPKLILQTEKDQRRLKQKEAYLRLYYSD